MATLLQSLTILVCLVFVPHPTSASYLRSPHPKRGGSNSGSHRPSYFKNTLFFRNSADFSEPKIGERGGSLVLECSVGGTFNPTVYWLKDGRIIRQGNRRNNVFVERRAYGLSQTSSRLTLDCLTEEDAGLYACVAENLDMRKVQLTNIGVARPDRMLYPTFSGCKGVSIKRGLPARIYMWTASKLEDEGTKVQLYCRANGYPAPTISWYDLSGQPISSGGQYKIARNGDLIIDDISWVENMGAYTCVAENALGEDTSTSFVYPMAKEVQK